MQFLRIIAFLLILLQYEASSSHNTHFAEELRDFQQSLIKRIYEDTTLDPKLDNEEIETITKAILDEADRRLKKREVIKNHKYHRKDDADDDKYEDNGFGRDSRIRHDAYKYIPSDVYRDILKLHNIYSVKGTDDGDGVNDEDNNKDNDGDNHNKGDYKRDVDDAQIEEFIDTRYKKEIGEKEIGQDVISQQKDRSSRTADVGDNYQVASVNVDNTPDIQTRIANNAKHLFLEPNINVSKAENKSSYAHHRLKPLPPRKIMTNKVDRSGLDKLAFIVIVVACCVAGISGIGLASFCWYKLRTETKNSKNGSTDFKSGSLRSSGYGKKSAEEDKLARGAEVFHYLHAKKQIQEMEEPSMKSSDHGCSINESTDEEEEEEDTVYECPGLAPPGDMKVVNPLFSDGESHYSDTQSLQSTTPTPPLEEK